MVGTTHGTGFNDTAKKPPKVVAKKPANKVTVAKKPANTVGVAKKPANKVGVAKRPANKVGVAKKGSLGSLKSFSGGNPSECP